MVVTASVTIGYDVPWRKVHALLLLGAGRTGGIRKEPAPRVLQRELSNFHVEYQLLAHLEEERSRAVVISDLHANIQDAFNEYDTHKSCRLISNHNRIARSWFRKQICTARRPRLRFLLPVRRGSPRENPIRGLKKTTALMSRSWQHRSFRPSNLVIKQQLGTIVMKIQIDRSWGLRRRAQRGRRLLAAMRRAVTMRPSPARKMSAPSAAKSKPRTFFKTSRNRPS